MLTMAVSGAYIAFAMGVMLSIIGGLLAFYLVATAWVTVLRRGGRPGIIEAVALVGALGIGAIALLAGFEAASSDTGLKDGFHPGQYFMFGAVALLAAGGDIRLFVLRGVSGAQRIARHLWRMCVALLIAASAFFLGQAQLFPAVVRESNILNVPVLLTFLLMLYWLYRVLGSRRRGGTVFPTAAGTAPRDDVELERLAVRSGLRPGGEQ